MCLNETWLKSHIQNHELCFNQFKLHRLDRQHKRGGGLLVLCPHAFCSEISNSIMSEHLELLHISIQKNLNAAPCQLILLYRPPNANQEMFRDTLFNFLNNIEFDKYPLLLLGDFNINMAQKPLSIHGKKLQNAL